MNSKFKINRTRCFLLILASLFLYGCINSDLNFIIKFTSVDGLKEGDSILHDKQLIGNVDEVLYTEQGVFLVSVSVKNEFVHKATKSALFTIDDKSGEKYVKLILGDELGNQIVDGEIVHGSTRLDAISREFKNTLSDSADSLVESINSAFSGLSEDTVEKQKKHFERQIDRLIDKVDKMTKDKKHRLNQEVIPELKEKLDQLEKTLTKQNMELEFERLKEKLNELLAKMT